MQQLTHLSTKRLFDEGASEHFLRVLNYDTERRNSVEELVDKVTDIDGDLGELITNYGGGFATSLFNGELGEAFYRADGNNTFILTDLYDPWEIELYIGDDPTKYKYVDYVHASWKGHYE